MKRLVDYTKEILYLLGDNRKRVGWLIVLFIASSFIDVAGLGILGPYLALVMNPEHIANFHMFAGLHKIVSAIPVNRVLVLLGASLVVIFLLKGVLAVFIYWKILNFSRKCRVDLQQKLMNAYQAQPYVEYLQRNSSEYIKTIHDATGNYVSSVEGALRMLSEGIVSFFILMFLAVTNGKILAMLLSLLGTTMVLYDRIFRRKSNMYGRLSTEGMQRIIQGIHEAILGLKELRILGKDHYFQRTVTSGAKEVSDNWAKAALIAMAPRYLLEFVLVTFVVMFVLISLTSGGNLTTILPTLGIFAVAAMRLLPSANLVTSGLSKLSYGRYAITLLYDDLKKVEKYTAVEIPSKPSLLYETFASLKIEDVSFQYPNSPQWALKNVSLTIKAGESIGIIGASGGGKTTLVDVLLGLLEPQKGRIEYNGHDLKDTLGNWRQQVAYLPQDIFLIDNTLRCNIALGVDEKNIEDKRVHEAIKQAQLEELVSELPKGLDTILGERGVRLSGGQRQRVALARAFYFGRNVLVLDEATSALDNQTEREIVEEIKRLKGHNTIIVIAHRLTTLQHCDRIYKLSKGEIVEAGSYELVVDKKS